MNMQRILVFLLFVGLGTMVLAQRQKPKNYSRFDERKIHFGFKLGINSADFAVYQAQDAYEQYGLVKLSNDAQPGGQLGIVSTLRLTKNAMWRLRFIPSLSFQERVLNYRFLDPENPGEILPHQERIGSTNLDLPLMVQYRTFRHNNFATYFLAGSQFVIDLQSQEDKSQSIVDPFVKIKRYDLQWQGGVGVEFFAPYFKFGMEIKYSQSFQDSFIQDNTPVSRPIDHLLNNVWYLSFIFEG